METTVKALVFAALAGAVLASTVDVALAQESVPIMRNYRGELICPSNYVIRGNACVHVEALRQRGLSTAERPGVPRGYPGYQDGPPPGYHGGYRREYDRDDYDDGPPRRVYRDNYYAGPPRGRSAVPPVVNWRGELQCPSNFVLHGKLCVSIY